MSERLKRYYPLLRAVAQIRNKRAQKLVLSQLRKHRPFAVLLKELADNVINQGIKLTDSQKVKLNRQAKIVRALSKKKKIDQSGGFLGTLVPILAAQIASLVADNV